MIIREAKFNDYNKIKILAQKYNLSIFEKDEWERIWKKNPYLIETNKDWPIGWVIEDQHTIVGHLSNIPTNYFYKNKHYFGSIISCWVVEPKYRLYSIKLIQKFHNQDKNDFFIATTSNIKTAKTLNAFGWQVMPELNFNSKLNFVFDIKKVFAAYLKKRSSLGFYFSKPLSVLANFLFKKKLNRWKNFQLEEKFDYYQKFDSDFDNLWQKLKEKERNLFLLNRESKWLNWHLYNKIKSNDLSIIVKKNKNNIVGYAVTVYKKDKELDIKKAVLIDLNTIESNEKILKNLILASVKKSLKDNCDLFQIVGFNKKKRDIMKSFDLFETKNKFSPFLFFTQNKELREFLQRKESWDPSEIDGDSIF